MPNSNPTDNSSNEADVENTINSSVTVVDVLDVAASAITGGMVGAVAGGVGAGLSFGGLFAAVGGIIGLCGGPAGAAGGAILGAKVGGIVGGLAGGVGLSVELVKDEIQDITNKRSAAEIEEVKKVANEEKKKSDDARKEFEKNSQDALNALQAVSDAKINEIENIHRAQEREQNQLIRKLKEKLDKNKIELKALNKVNQELNTEIEPLIQIISGLEQENLSLQQKITRLESKLLTSGIDLTDVSEITQENRLLKKEKEQLKAEIAWLKGGIEKESLKSEDKGKGKARTVTSPQDPKSTAALIGKSRYPTVSGASSSSGKQVSTEASKAP